MYAICMKNTMLYYKAKNALYKRHGWNYEKFYCINMSFLTVR